MNAIQIADSFDSFAIDHTPDGWPAVQQKQLTEAALMLRKQHEAIKVLRGALGEIAKTPWVDAALDPQRPRLIAKQTLADTEEICKTTSQ